MPSLLNQYRYNTHKHITFCTHICDKVSDDASLFKPNCRHTDPNCRHIDAHGHKLTCRNMSVSFIMPPLLNCSLPRYKAIPRHKVFSTQKCCTISDCYFSFTMTKQRKPCEPCTRLSKEWTTTDNSMHPHDQLHVCIHTRTHTHTHTYACTKNMLLTSFLSLLCR